jgi:hypothetical protein
MPLLQRWPSQWPSVWLKRRRAWLLSLPLAALLLAGGCSTLDEQQRKWIFQPSDGTCAPCPEDWFVVGRFAAQCSSAGAAI